MTTATQVLDVARSQLGVTEGPRANEVAYNTWYYGRVVHGPGYPWCATFVSWVAQQSGACDLIPRHSYTPAGAAWFTQRGRWGPTPRIGAVVFYDWPGDRIDRISHVALVEAVNGDGTITTIEGNTDVAGGRTGGRVMRQRRRAAIVGYGYPAYSGQPSTLASPIPANVVADAGAAPELRIGCRGAVVQEVQRVVGATVDGVFGPKTRSAVRRFQREHGLADDGVVGPLTWAVIRGAAASTATPVPVPVRPARPMIRRGSTGADVAYAQRLLGVTADGVFGRRTQAAVLDFQRRHGLECDGVIGPATWARLG